MSGEQGATHHRPVILLALVALLTTAIAATAGASPEPARARAGSAPRSAEVPCQARQLGARLATRPATPGREHVLLVLSNHGPTSCGMFGFVGLEMLGPDGSALVTDLERAGTSRPATEVVVPPTGEAAALLSWVTFSADEGCVAPAGVEVTPPNDTAALVLPWPTTGLVCRFGQIDLEPVHSLAAGRARPPAAGGAQAAPARPGAVGLDRGPA